MSCMFCGTNNDLTSEHVFPAFMGGELEVRDGSCKKCNEEFGKLEASLKENTKLLLNLLQIENRYGGVPTVKVNVAIQGIDSKTLNGLRDGEGELKLSDVVIDRGVQDDGKRHREGFFVSQQSAEKFLERARKRGDNVTELGVPKEIVIVSGYTITLPFAFSIETRKVVGKIALAAILRHV